MSASAELSPADFDEYLRQGEPRRSERAGAWQAAIGLQEVDGLRPSAYLVETARRHIEGDISIDEVKPLLDGYYRSREGRALAASGSEEADRVAAAIARLLGEQTFTFSPMGFMSIHRRLFEDVFPFAGKLRDCNITKKEWVLRGDTVLYTSACDVQATLDYDFAQEKKFRYADLEPADMVRHFARFVAGLWQIHPFMEGNTRTTAVFAIKYLRFMGFEVGNEMFATHSWFFRNALVRANYRHYHKAIEPDPLPLERFFSNIILNERHELKNRYLLVPEGLPGEDDGAPLEAREDEAPEYDVETARQTAENRTATKVKPHSNGNTMRISAKMQQLLCALAGGQRSVKELLLALGLHQRQSLMKARLLPAMEQGLVCALHPDTPSHRNQRYLLTEKGRRLWEMLDAPRR